MQKTLFLTGIALSITSCQNLDSSNFHEELDWITGKWAIDTPPIYAEENWEWSEDRYIANGFMLNATDTIFIETLTIKPVKNNLFLTARVKDQNNNKEVFFKLISNSSDSLLFENKRHNYPNYIEYVLESDSTIRAKAYGIINGQKKEDVLFYKKQK